MVLTHDVADWLTDLCLDAIPALTVERASASILDTLGATLAGLDEPAAEIAARLAASDGAAQVASQLGTSFATYPNRSKLMGFSDHLSSVSLDFGRQRRRL